ncbi:MAG: PfkB family carbohydrate kinase, partial [Armatimonadota bacterium]|nr:PfkB family carbohydrate kinase [Armatimonadota bacterium]
MFSNLSTVVDCVEKGFGGKKVLVVGDFMLDRHVRGKVSRISPEAPVPIVAVTSRSETPGGAGNVAVNAAQLGLRVVASGFVGMDQEGEDLRRLLSQTGVST